MTGYTSLLKKTGQTTSYVTGDDGDLEKGVAHSYTVLDTGQYSSTTNITMDGRTDTHSNECVLDNVTGLMWSRNLSASVGPDPFGKGSIGNMPWTTDANGNGIFPYKSAANSASLSGYTDWRIPNFIELLSIYDLETKYAFSPAFSFTYPVWSSDTYGVINGIFVASPPGSIAAKDSLQFVLLVRGDPTAPSGGGNSLIHGMVD